MRTEQVCERASEEGMDFGNALFCLFQPHPTPGEPIMKPAKTFLHLTAVLAATFCLLPPALADTETVDGVEWTYTVSDGEATVSGAAPTEGDLAIPSTLGGFPVTDIGQDAFSFRTGLTSVTIPDSVTSIGNDAFEYCTGLANVTIPDNVTNIGGYAFYGCSGLTNVMIGNSVTSIGAAVFYGCSGLTELTIPDGLTGIGDDAFAWCSSLENVTIPDSVTNIGENVFYYCTGLADIEVGFGNAT